MSSGTIQVNEFKNNNITWQSNVDLNTITSPGLYAVGNGLTNAPLNSGWFILSVFGRVDTLEQVAYGQSGIFSREQRSGTWSSWLTSCPAYGSIKGDSGTGYNVSHTTVGCVCIADISLTKRAGVNDTTVNLPRPRNNLCFLLRDNTTGKRVDVTLAKGSTDTTAILSFYNANHTPVDGTTYTGQVAYIYS